MQRFLNRVLRRGEVAEASHDCAEHLWRQFAQQVLGCEVLSVCRHTWVMLYLRTSRAAPL